jgi:uncharacterized protein YunC (DUF1805 family)
MLVPFVCSTDSPKDMLTAKVSSVSESAAAAGIVPGLTGAEVLDKIR